MSEASFLALLAATSRTAAVGSDLEGRISYWNSGAEAIFGFTAGEAMGRSLDIIVPATHQGAHWHAFKHRMGSDWGGNRRWSPCPGLHKDGRVFSLDSTALPIHDEAGRCAGVIAFFCLPKESA